MGDLGDFGVVGILHVLAARRANGRLRLSAEGEELSIFLADGQLTLLTSSFLPPRLGRVLHQRGLISTYQLHEALRIQAAEGHDRSLGEVIVAQGWSTPAQVAACVHEQFVGALARIMTTRRGMFAWDPGIEAPARGIPLPLEPERVLRDASRWLTELAKLRAELPAPYTPLAPHAQLDVSVVPHNEIESRIVAALKSGAVSWRDLTDLLPLDAKTLLGTLVSMLRRGLLVAAGSGWDGEQDAPGGDPPGEADLARLLGVQPATTP
ncbi:MAG: hypothetical protein QOF73_1968 [Thermomicrobiales bacterium]|nr:hypothetical protein [Thermomicrobiales bacterium]